MLHLHLGTIFVLLWLGFQTSYKMASFKMSIHQQTVLHSLFVFSNVYVMGGTAMHFDIFIFIMKLCWCIRLLSNGLPLINSLCCALALSEANRRR